MQTTREMTAPLPGRPMLHALAKSWWLLLLRGIAAIIFGILAFVWPGLTLVTLVLLYGAFALVDGVISLIAAFTGSAKPVPTWWLVVVGLLGIAAGIVTFAWPGITAILLMLFIGAWALVHGIFEIIGAIQLRKEIDNEWMLILGGLLSVVFGLIVLFAPGAGALGLIWVIASYSIVFGILFIALALRLQEIRPSSWAGRGSMRERGIARCDAATSGELRLVRTPGGRGCVGSQGTADRYYKLLPWRRDRRCLNLGHRSGLPNDRQRLGRYASLTAAMALGRAFGKGAEFVWDKEKTRQLHRETR